MNTSSGWNRIVTATGYSSILLGAAFNEWSLGLLLSPDGTFESTSIRLRIYLLHLVLFTAGFLIIAYRYQLGERRIVVQRLLKRVVAFAVSTIIAVYCVDNLLYLASPYLPTDIARMLSPRAQIRYYETNAKSVLWIFAENIRFGKPNTVVDGYMTDSLGYRNPTNYLQTHQNIDVVLLGDSFTWGTEAKTIADYLRETLSPATVYSLGVGAEAIPHWRYHFARFHATTPPHNPKVALLNFYSGNDIHETKFYLNVKQYNGGVDSKIYFAYLGEQADLRKSALTRFLSLQEILHFVENARQELPPEEKILFDGANNELYHVWQRGEPDPASLDQSVLHELETTVTEIRRLAPETAVVLSYIPTSDALYGDRFVGCPECGAQIQRQQMNSEKLRDFAEKLKILYVDPTRALRAEARTKVLWSRNHFNAEGYRTYSELVARAIRRMVAGSSE